MRNESAAEALETIPAASTAANTVPSCGNAVFIWKQDSASRRGFELNCRMNCADGTIILASNLFTGHHE